MHSMKFQRGCGGGARAVREHVTDRCEERKQDEKKIFNEIEAERRLSLEG